MNLIASGDRLSAENVDMLRSEIERCVRTCSHPVLAPGYIPSRLLFIGTDDGGENQLRLENREDVIAKANLAGTEPTGYAALSYCWGSPDDAEKQCKTEWRSLRAWRGGIPDRYLSPVVRDAVILTRRLNICYLWVDALCIIQDDFDDWQRESPLMGPVYSNAHFTIMLLNSSTCQQGFLTRRPSGDEEPSGGQAPSGPEYKLHVDWRAAAWTCRGWTFQEEKLSTRHVYVGPSRMYFCCNSGVTAEDSPERGSVSEKSVLHMLKKASASGRGIRSLMRFWEVNMVPQFSNREFSRPQDKLQAIASVAKCIGDHTGYDYAAGLWVPRIHIELIWHYRPTHARLQDLIEELHTDGSTFIAPSWSWARFGTVRGLRFLFSAWKQQRRLKLEARLETPVIETIGTDLYGQVRKGSLQLQTKVLRLPPGHDMSGRAWPEGQETFLLDWSMHEENSVSAAKLELIVIGSDVGSGTTGKRLYGIVAYPAYTASGTYYRVGIFERHVDRFQEFDSMEPRVITII